MAAPLLPSGRGVGVGMRSGYEIIVGDKKIEGSHLWEERNMHVSYVPVVFVSWVHMSIKVGKKFFR